MPSKDIQLSSEFKSQAKKSIYSVITFIVVYLLILLAAIAVTIASVYVGVTIISLKVHLFTIGIGLGVSVFGLLILFFLIKFIFKSSSFDRSHLLEVKREDQPTLFKLIDEVVAAVDTNSPKKVYLSADVNASVFYDSSFWSMFFPIKKNLQIGVGLINSISAIELKAILSHEFGHFSQSSMKVGSYTYNLNKIVHNILYENEGFDDLAKSLAGMSGYLGIFVVLAHNVVGGIKSILTSFYESLNSTYSGLSREMEFHADEIAANITGYQPLKRSLLRMSLADHALNSVISFYGRHHEKGFMSANIYREHSIVMRHLAQYSDIPIKDNLPQVDESELRRYDKSRLVIKDQWASHPSLEERIERLEKTNKNEIGEIFALASEHLDNPGEIEKKLTDFVFQEVDNADFKVLNIEKFTEEWLLELKQDNFSKSFNSYYDNKNPIPFDFDASYESLADDKCGNLFSDENVELVYRYVALENDINILNDISNKVIKIRSFDFDGVKFLNSEAYSLIEKLKEELCELKIQIEALDIRIFKSFENLESELGLEPRLRLLYSDLFQFDKEFDHKYKIYNEITQDLQFTSEITEYVEIRHNFKELKSNEKKLKVAIQELVANSKFDSLFSDDIRLSFDSYLSKDWIYFSEEEYLEDNLAVLYNALNNFLFLLSKGFFVYKKDLLDYKEKLMLEEK